MKGRYIQLPQSVFGNFHGVVVAAAFRSTVADKMLWAGRDAIRGIQARALIAADIRASDRRAEKRIFAGTFGHSSPARISGDIHHWRKRPADAACGSFTSRNAGCLVNMIRIPTVSQHQLYT